MVKDFLLPLITIGLAEFGDKTQLSILLLSAKTKKHTQLLLGTLLAFLVADGVAVWAGSRITNFVPLRIVKALSAVAFAICGVIFLMTKKMEIQSKTYSRSPFLLAFVLVSLAEWGDKTQIALTLFATRLNPYFVLAGAMISLILLSSMAIYLGKSLSFNLRPHLINRIAGFLFIIIGISFLLF